MDPGMSALLRRIVNTLSITVLYMVMNTTPGIMYDLAFIHDGIRLGNILFYIWCAASTFFYLRWLIRTWNKPLV